MVRMITSETKEDLRKKVKTKVCLFIPSWASTGSKYHTLESLVCSHVSTLVQKKD